MAQAFPIIQSTASNYRRGGHSDACNRFGSGRGRVSPGPATPLDRRVRTSWNSEYASLFDEVGRLDQEVKTKAREFSEKLKVESAEREKADKRCEEQLQEAIVGQVHLDYAGVAYFVLGTIAGTASSDIARWLGAAQCN